MSDESLDSLFTEASDELRTDVEDHLSDAEAILPDVDTVWETDAGNVIGVLNQLKAALDGEGVHEPYKEARKWFLLGAEANAFDDDVHDAFEKRFDAVSDAIEQLDLTSEHVAGLTPMFPELRATLDKVGEGVDTDTEEDSDGSEENSDGKGVNSEPLRSEEPVDNIDVDDGADGSASTDDTGDDQGGEDDAGDEGHESGQVEEWGT